ncbi:MAG: oxygen-independent coproporphyrinogen III oxidase, partial [Bdellovibrionales bacterium]|nr:oxygen-independent coproporphyrinogen III oxidase [Bdellovibrionales bacterium]
DNWISHLKKSYDDQEGMDLYVHIPFCEKLCYYCGCNRIITKNKNVQDNFVDLILSEWDLYCDHLGIIPAINSVHFGGGTPTFLSPANFEKIILGLTKNKKQNFKGSVEIDPRNVSLEHLDNFKRNGITRVSLGIQDFDPSVQKAINRLQPFEMVEALVNELRAREFESINFDVIYGLPKQTKETISRTFHLIRQLRPDMIAYYSYAHLPEKIKNQRLIKNEDLLLSEDKHALYELGKEILSLDGYEDIGMDHFALPHNFLYKAKIGHELHRNFMGYVDKKSNVLIGLGPSSISDSSLSFIQNEKDLSQYELKIQKRELPISNGHEHSIDDLAVQKIILDLMCNQVCHLYNYENVPYWRDVENDLLEMQSDGLVKIEDRKIIISEIGKRFLRNVAMCFDFHFREKIPTSKFSRTI